MMDGAEGRKTTGTEKAPPIERLDAATPDVARQNAEKIAALFPDVITEGPEGDGPHIDFDLLRQALSDHLVEGPAERYRLDWPGKRQAMLLANTPTTKTLRPVREDSVDFDTTRNLFIEGDNLEALKILQETYLGKIKMIYIDPPYNTGSNLIYKNDFRTTKDIFDIASGNVDQDGRALVANRESNGRFHSDWLSSFYSVIRTSRRILRDDGVLVCAIDENEQAAAELIFKEIYGETSYDVVSMSIVHNPRGIQGDNFSRTHEFAIVVTPRKGGFISEREIPEEEVDWANLRNWGGESERQYGEKANTFYPIIVEDGKIIGVGPVCVPDEHPPQNLKLDGKVYVYPVDPKGDERKWRYASQSFEKIKNMLRAREVAGKIEVEIGKTFGSQRALWSGSRYDASIYGSQLVEKLMPGCGFTYPKSLWTVYDFIDIVCRDDKDAIVVDFYAGTSTTAHAVTQYNLDRGGRRQSIMIQYPQPITDPVGASQATKNAVKKSKAFLTDLGKPHTIAEISKERIRRAGAKIFVENADLKGSLDVGFRAFRVDSSNFHDTRLTVADAEAVSTDDDARQTLLDGLTSHIKNDRSDEDLLFGALLAWGVDITLPMRRDTVEGRDVLLIDAPDDSAEGAALIACFAMDVDVALAAALAALKPLRVVFRDDGFVDDATKENVASRFRQLAPDTALRVL